MENFNLAEIYMKPIKPINFQKNEIKILFLYACVCVPKFIRMCVFTCMCGCMLDEWVCLFMYVHT